MTGAVRNLSELLRDARTAIGQAHDKVDRLRKAVGHLNDGYDKVDSLTEEVQSAANEVHAMVGQISNGGPATAVSTATFQAESPVQEATQQPIGFLNMHHGTGDPKKR